MPGPVEAGGEIPKEPFAVATRNSTYEFGSADEKDERTVTKNRKPLPFTHCRIIFLAKGKPMKFVPVVSDGIWHTSTVQSITVG